MGDVLVLEHHQVCGLVTHHESVARTVAAFKAINPDYVIPAHCTGLNTIMAVHREMPAKLIMPSTGTRVVFGA